MNHPTKAFTALLLLGTILCGCSQQEDFGANDNNGEISEKIAGTVFRFQTNASNGLLTKSAEDSYKPSQGTPDEYKVNNVRVYLFDTSTKLFAKSFKLTSLTHKGSDEAGNIIYETEHVSVPQGTYDIFVTANTDRQIEKTTEAEFLADIDRTSYARALIEDISGGIMMTNRASANTGTVIANTSGNEETVVNITLERVLARIDIAKGSETFQLTDDEGKMYAKITLDGYYIVNLAKHFYTFRHTAVLTSLTEPSWSISENFGDIQDVNGYVIDPYFFKKTIDASAFDNSDKFYENFWGDYSNPSAVTWTAFKPVVASGDPQFNTVYSLENCALFPAQKNGYSTGVIFRSKMEPNNNVYHLAGDGSMELVTDPNNYPEVLYYYNYKFYDSAEALAAAIGTTTISGVSLDLYKAQKFEKTDDGYRSYYIYWIRHLDNNKPTNMGVMEFAIVRNNLYSLVVTNVSGLGYNNPIVDPDIPDEGETSLSLIVNVKPWIVRDQTNIVL